MSEYESGSSGSDGQTMVAQAQEKVQEKAQEASSLAARYMREQAETRTTQASGELRTFARAMERSGHALHAEGNDAHARVIERVTETLDRSSRYLESATGDRLLQDVESFGRRRPWAMIGAGAALGFVASRFLKASSRTRYDASVVTRPEGAVPAIPPYASPMPVEPPRHEPMPPAPTVPPVVDTPAATRY